MHSSQDSFAGKAMAVRVCARAVSGRQLDLAPLIVRQGHAAIGRSPRRPGRRTQRIKARLLFVVQRIVEFRELGLHRLHCGKRGFKALLHRLDPAGWRQHLVGRAAGLKPFPCLDGRILQFIESRPLLGRGLYRLGDAIDRQVGSCPADNGC